MEAEKCEHQVENMFSIEFSRTQPNTKKYFSKYVLKCHQTPENILHLENILHRAKHSLKHMFFSACAKHSLISQDKCLI